MTERLLQFIWQFQYFSKAHLCTDSDEQLEILHPGTFNRNQGPDFLNGSVRVGPTLWAGHIELHVRASDWNRHRHTEDLNYRNVILHVVWENDLSIRQSPTLSLRERVPKVLLDRYEQLMQDSLRQACRPFLPALSAMGWLSWKERLLAERLERKATRVIALLEESRQHWEEVLWWQLAANFGVTVNCEAFEMMARSLSVKILAKHKHQLIQIEALLFGQANLLSGVYKEDYPRMLQKEYRYLRKKYGLNTHRVLPHFLRMRPANFPTVRLAQLAVLVNQSSHLFSKIRDTRTANELKKLLDVTANDYWHYHYLFDETTDYKPKHLGSQMAENIIINTVAPVIFAYGTFTGNVVYREKAIAWLQELAPEPNAITRQWAEAGVANASAFDSQSLIELTNNYCHCQRCLDCAVGCSVLKA